MGLWKNIAKIGLMAAPFVAMPFTAGASLALIGAGAGAGGAKLSGAGWKGAALSAGLGAIPGLTGAGKAASSAGSLMNQAIPPAVLAARGGGTMASPALFSTIGRFFGSPGGQAVTNLAGSLGGAYIQNRGANRALDVQGRYNDRALDFLREQDARDYAEYLRERDRDWRYEDEDRGYKQEDRLRANRFRDEYEARRGPARQIGARGFTTLADLLLGEGGSQYTPVSVGSGRTPAALKDGDIITIPGRTAVDDATRYARTDPRVRQRRLVSYADLLA